MKSLSRHGHEENLGHSLEILTPIFEILILQVQEFCNNMTYKEAKSGSW